VKYKGKRTSREYTFILFLILSGNNVVIPFKFTAKNMGKNDIWIAATASVPDVDLLTSDKDFVHLDRAYMRLAKG